MTLDYRFKQITTSILSILSNKKNGRSYMLEYLFLIIGER